MVERALTSKSVKASLAEDLDGSRREALEAALRTAGSKPLVDEHEAGRALDRALSDTGLSVATNVRKALLGGLLTKDHGAPVLKKGRQPVADADLRDTENVPLNEDIHAYFDREVSPYVPDAWIDESKTKVGYEIPFARHFYVYTPPRALEEIDAEIKELEDEVLRLLGEVTA
jgi:type I restriction enzyme M protein